VTILRCQKYYNYLIYKKNIAFWRLDIGHRDNRTLVWEASEHIITRRTMTAFLFIKTELKLPETLEGFINMLDS